MKNLTKKFIVLLLVMVLGSTSITTMQPPIQTYGQMKDITGQLSDKEIDGLITMLQSDLFSVAFSEYIYNNMYTGQSVKFDFSKNSKRKYILKYLGVYDRGYKELGGGSPNTISKRLFGAGTSGIKVVIGEVGDLYPAIGYGERLYVYKESNNKITVGFSIYTIEDGYAGSDTIGFVDYTIKRKPGSKYGWIIKSAIVEKI